MAALTSNYEAKRQDGIILSYPVAENTTIYKGALLQTPTTGADQGYAQPLANGTNRLFIGVAVEGVDNSSGSRGVKEVRVYKTGTFQYTKSTSAQADVGVKVFGRDDNTIDTTTTNSVFVGYIVGIVNNSTAKVRIDNAADVVNPST